jgi:hypothetical protein
MQINVNIALAKPANKIVTVRRWGDPILLALDGMTTENMVSGSFQEVPLFHPYTDNPTRGEFGAISYFQHMGIPERDYLKSIQPDDYAQYGFTIPQKMNLLIQPPPATPPQRAYWSKTGGAWNEPTFTEMSFGTLVFGGQRVQVEAEEFYFYAKYRAKDVMEWIPFYKIVGMRRAEMARPVNELLAEGLMQRYTVANKGAGQENVYNDHPRGVIYHPIWSPRDWHVNTGTPDALYLAKEFCL